MLTFDKSETGRLIASVEGGEYHKKKLYLEINPQAKKEIKIKDPMSFLGKDFFKATSNNRITQLQLHKLTKCLERDIPPEDDFLYDLYLKAKKHLDNAGSREIVLSSGRIQVIPNKDQNQGERVYVAGPSGSGKSTWTSNYVKEFRKLFPSRELYIFSKVEKDEVLDKLDPIRIALDEEIIDDPITIEELQKSICVFDDIDTIANKHVLDSVMNLRSQILSEGRHENVYCICTSHQLMNYKKTRDLINESSLVIFFLGSGSDYHIDRFLKNYCGLSKGDVYKIMHLPSRWCCIHKNYPLYCVYESGCFLLGEERKKDLTDKEILENYESE